MANNSSTLTGLLMLTQITPVIKALFGDFNVEEHDAESAYISFDTEGDFTSWYYVLERVAELAEELGISVPEGDEEDGYRLALIALLNHYQNISGEANPEVSQILIELEEIAEMGELDSTEPMLGDLLWLAKAMDDGHGLTALQTEVAWVCDRKRLFEFGGAGKFRGSFAFVSQDSSAALRLGLALESNLAQGNVTEAAKLVTSTVTELLDGIRDPKHRAEIQAILAAELAATEPKPSVSDDELDQVVVFVNGGCVQAVAASGTLHQNLKCTIVDNDNGDSVETYFDCTQGQFDKKFHYIF